jgi:hypothetical protein
VNVLGCFGFEDRQAPRTRDRKHIQNAALRSK